MSAALVAWSNTFMARARAVFDWRTEITERPGMMRTARDQMESVLRTEHILALESVKTVLTLSPDDTAALDVHIDYVRGMP